MIERTAPKSDKDRVAEAQVERRGEPVWELAYLYPPQGEWHESEYLALETNRLIEFDNGYLEVLPMPTPAHQFIVAYLYRTLETFVTNHGLGNVLFAPLRVQLWLRKFREPDVVFLSTEHSERIGHKFVHGADLVMEVVSDSVEDRERDLVTKRKEYALAGITEYWIIDPENHQVTVLRLDGEQYAVHGEFRAGRQATSVLLAGFAVDVDALFAAADPKREQ